MQFIANELFHVYNRGNNRQLIFFNERNYLFFLRKIKEQILPVADIVSYCLMPNHFHLILKPKQKGLKTRITFGGKPIQELSYRIGILLSSYSQAINKQNKTTGSLFQQKTKAKILCETYNGAIISYFEQCFHYVHQNPLRAGLVKDLEEWPYSSYRFYLGLEGESICNKEIFFDMTGLTLADMKMRISLELEEEKIKKFMD